MRLLVIALFTCLCTSARGQECFRTSVTVPSPFMGNHSEIFRTADGGIYEVVGSYEYLYAYSPGVTICPSRGKMLVDGKTVSISPIRDVLKPPSASRGDTKEADPRSRRASNAKITVILRVRSCDYFLADGPRGLYLLEWYGGYDPNRSDGIFGELGSYGFKDVIYENGREGRLYVDDYMLGEDRALEKLGEKCN